MSRDTEMVVIFGVLHLVALGLVGMLLLMFLRSEPAAHRREPGADSDGGGGCEPPRPARPRGPGDGGLLLPDASPARRRLRGPGRLGEDTRPVRRPAHEPLPAPPRVPAS